MTGTKSKVIDALIDEIQNCNLVRDLHEKSAFDIHSSVSIDEVDIKDDEFGRMALHGVIEFSTGGEAKVSRVWLTSRGVALFTGNGSGWKDGIEEATCPFHRDL